MTNEKMIAEIRQGNADLLENLFVDNMPLVNKIIRRYFPAHEADDLRQEAFFTLLRVVDNYSPEKGAFSTYYMQALRWDLERYLTNNNGGAKIPPGINEKLKALNRCRKELETEKGSVTQAALAKAMQISPAELDTLLQAENIRSPASIYAPINEEGQALADMLHGSEGIENDIVNREALAGIWDTVQEKLNEQAAHVVTSYYRDNKTTQELADSLGLTVDRITSIRHTALVKLKNVRELKRLIDFEIYSEGITPGNFRRSMTSSTERVALQLEEIERRAWNILQEGRKNKNDF